MCDRRLTAAALVLVLVLGAPLALAPRTAGASQTAQATAATDDAARLRAAIEAVLDPDTRWGGNRLPSVRIDATGDATVVFALRGEGTIAGIRDRGAADMLAILRAAYHPPVTEAVLTMTVIGTFSVAGGRSTREWPVMRAVLARIRADALDWERLASDDLPRVLDTWWVYPPLLTTHGTEAMPIASPVASPPASMVRMRYAGNAPCNNRSQLPCMMRAMSGSE